MEKTVFTDTTAISTITRAENDGVSQILAGNQTMGGLSVKGIELVPSQQGYKQLLVKLNKTSATSMIGRTIRVVLDLNVNGKINPLQLTLPPHTHVTLHHITCLPLSRLITE